MCMDRCKHPQKIIPRTCTFDETNAFWSEDWAPQSRTVSQKQLLCGRFVLYVLNETVLSGFSGGLWIGHIHLLSYFQWRKTQFLWWTIYWTVLEAEHKWLFSWEIALSDHQLITNQSGLNDPVDLWVKFERLFDNKVDGLCCSFWHPFRWNAETCSCEMCTPLTFEADL